MGIGMSMCLMAVGAVLVFGVELPADGINLDTVGVIFILLGLLGLLFGLVSSEDWTPPRRVPSRHVPSDRR